MPDDAPDLVRRLDDSESLARQWELNAEEFADRDMPRMADAAIQMASYIRAQADEIAALRARDNEIAQDLDEIFAATFGNVGSEPNVYADYDNCTQLQGKMRRAIQLLRPLPPAPDAEGG